MKGAKMKIGRLHTQVEQCFYFIRQGKSLAFMTASVNTWAHICGEYPKDNTDLDFDRLKMKVTHKNTGAFMQVVVPCGVIGISPSYIDACNELSVITERSLDLIRRKRTG